MADRKKIAPGNVEGDFFVDTSCINCSTSRTMAPTVFGELGDHAVVKKQPETKTEYRQAMRALLCCPAGSIGTLGPNKSAETLRDFPLVIDRNVYHCGFNSPKSFGGFSYLVIDSGGNWMVDAPRFNSHVSKFLEANGGLKYILLTHKDDCADEARYADHFSAKRIIHEAELEAQPDAEVVIRGFDEVEISEDFKVIPQPGHTEGHCMLLYLNKYLFSGDVFTSVDNALAVHSPLWTWHSWNELVRSLEKLREFRFEWVLPGHGRRVSATADEMQRQLARVIKKAGTMQDEDSPQRLANLELYTQAMRSLDMPKEAAKFQLRADEMRDRLER